MVTLRHILLLLLIATRLHGQAYSPRTQIRIIGTVHSGNSQLSYRNLYLVIQQYKPDIILYEQSTRYKNIIGIRTAKALHISKPSIEKLSITKYKKNNKKCIILPYDTAFTRRKYIKNYIKLYNSLYNKLDNAVMTTDDSLLYSKHIKLRNNYYSNINNQNLELLNTIEVYSMSDTLNEQGNRIVLPLAKKYLLDTLLINNYETDLQFWILRNNYMVSQIKNYIEVYEGKKILVLTGLNHKYYLEKYL